MDFNVTSDNAPKCPDEIVDLSWVRAAHGVGNTYAVDANLVDGLVDGQKIDEIGTEGVL